MDTNLEIEFKTLLTKDQFEQLNKHLFQHEPIKQINTYYDNTNRDLFHQNIMMRIRHIEGQSQEFTIKESQVDGVMEYSYIDELIDINNDKVTQFLNTQEIEGPFEMIAQSTTYRILLIDELGEWALDHSIYDNGEDFELEYEITGDFPKAQKRYLKLLKDYNIQYQQAEPKFIRALKATSL